MSKLNDKRDNWVNKARETLISKLPAPKWADQIDIDEDEIKRSGTTLAAVYRDLALPMLFSVFTLAASLVLIDVLFHLSPQIYGLYIDVLAAIFFLTPSLKSSEDIAIAVASEEDAIRIKEAEEMVANNVGFIVLLCGFGIQGLAVQSRRVELIGENLLTSFPGFVVYLVLPLAGVSAFFVLGRARSHFQEERRDGLPMLMGNPTRHEKR